MKISPLIQLARVPHWIKNLIVLLPMFFALEFRRPWAWAMALLAMAAFCLASSAIYVVNDIHDRHRDRLHPRKKDRPIASGRVRIPVAWAWAGALGVAGLALATAVNWAVLVILVAYLVMQAGYTFLLKHKMLVDVICIALGFVFRAVAGAAAIHVWASPWLIICTFTICLFMGFCKRRSEVATLGDQSEAGKHRATLSGYTPELLTHLITLSAAVAILSYLLYATHPDTVARFHTEAPLLVYTLPAIVYAVCRFAMLSMVGKYADPTELILRDWPFQVAIAAWALATFALITCGQHIHDVVLHMLGVK